MRSFTSDLNVAGNVVHSLRTLRELLSKEPTSRRSPPERGAPDPTEAEGLLTFEAASAAIADLVDDETVIFNEYPLRLPYCPLDRPGSYFGLSTAGGLGWGFGAALGFKLAAPEKFVIATLGDGSYIFANPIAGHTVAGAEKLPILLVVFNNHRYGAVQRSTLSMYSQGEAAQSNGLFFAQLDGTPDFAEIARAHGAHAETVTSLPELSAALEEAKRVVLSGCQALLNLEISN